MHIKSIRLLLRYGSFPSLSSYFQPLLLLELEFTIFVMAFFCASISANNDSIDIKCKLPATTKINATQQQQQQQPLQWLTSAEMQPNQETVSNRQNIFEKLKRLGTSIYYENEMELACNEQDNQTDKYATSIPNEINTIDSTEKVSTMTLKNRIKNESNEILMTFDTAVTEVFPIEFLYQYSCDQDRKFHPNMNDIIKNIPKSLTITII